MNPAYLEITRAYADYCRRSWGHSRNAALCSMYNWASSCSRMNTDAEAKFFKCIEVWTIRQLNGRYKVSDHNGRFYPW